MFETKVVLVDKYGDVVFELEESGMFYKLPAEARGLMLDVGDEYRVEEIEVEVD